MSYRIASLNLKKSLRNEEQGRDFCDFIYKMIACEGIDIFAFQEAYSSKVIEGIIKRLKRNRLKHWTGTHAYESEFSFIWNTDKVIECSKSAEPRIYNEYYADVRLKRDPLYGRFSPVFVGPNREFRLINIHIKHGGDDKRSTIEDRVKECELVKDTIHKKIDTKRYGNFKRAFTVVLGDYNLDCARCNCCGPTNVETFQEEETTLKMKEDGYNNSYDHFSFDTKKNATVPYKVSRIDAVQRYFGGDFDKYRKNVSDHVPVLLEIF